jgi:hypothetical protein
VIRSCRTSPTPREQLRGRSLRVKSFGLSSFADHKREFLNTLAAELRDAIKQHWISKDASADWERLVREQHEAAILAATAPTTAGDSDAQSPAAPANDMTPLALRGRFKEHMSLEFTSEVLRQIEQRFEARDDRGRPLILPRDARSIADTARAVAASLVERLKGQSGKGSRFADSPALRGLIATGSQRIVSQAVEKFDVRQPERFLPADAVDELIQAECRRLLDESLLSRDLAAALLALFDHEQTATSTICDAEIDLLQSGYDRRTLFFVPRESTQSLVEERLRAARPHAASFSADVDDLVVVTEAAGIAPRSLASGLERVFPGIAEAARRLLTRIDIEWRSLT